jgi:hypothetical protein
MGIRAVIPSAFVAALVSTLACGAQTFGELNPRQQAGSFAPTGLLTDPALTRWMLTLPSEGALGSSAIEPPLEARVFDPTPIGGEVYQLATAERGPIETGPNAALSTQIFAGNPIGGEVYTMAPNQAAARAVAENAVQADAGPPMQGRSVAKRRGLRAPQKPRAALASAPINRHRLSSCHCGLRTGRSAASPRRHVQPESEGRADLPALRGPAGSFTPAPLFNSPF